MRHARRLVRFLFAILALVALGTLVPWPFTLPDRPVGGLDRRILVLSNPIHTDLAVPVDADVLARFGFLADRGVPIDAPDARWLILGWGSRAFYLETPSWSDVKPLPLLKSMTVDRSVLHVDVSGLIPLDHPAVSSFVVDGRAFQAMLDAVEASFTKGADGRPIAVPDRAYGETDAFYEAEGLFTAIVGCNLWTARMLRTAGLKAGLWTPLPALLTASLALHN